MPQNVKSPFLSKTVWLNSIGLLLSAVLPFVPHAAGLNQWIASHLALLGSVWAGLGIALRFITKDKLQLGE